MGKFNFDAMNFFYLYFVYVLYRFMACQQVFIILVFILLLLLFHCFYTNVPSNLNVSLNSFDFFFFFV